MQRGEKLAWMLIVFGGAGTGAAGMMVLTTMRTPAPPEVRDAVPDLVLEAPVPVPAEPRGTASKILGRLPPARGRDDPAFALAAIPQQPRAQTMPEAVIGDEGGSDSLAPWITDTRPQLPPIDVPQTRRFPPNSLPWLSKPAPQKRYTLKERLDEISPGATARLAAKFAAAKADWPVAEIGLVAIKNERLLDLYARSEGSKTWTLIHRYPVLAASGGSGPKLKQGDKQVPEGIYGISFLNPNSKYHVSLRVNYPNAFDRQMATKDGRKDLGGDIMIHGKAASIGCLAIGDEAAEELFVLAARTGLENIRLVIAPADFRREGVLEEAKSQKGQPTWVPELYAEIASAMAEFPAPEQGGLLSFVKGLALNQP